MHYRWKNFLCRCALALCGATMTVSLACAGASDGKLDIYWIDTEGGAATLLVSPTGESVLIDAGNPGVRDANRIVKAASEAGLKKIDHLITTHYHIDHFGGAPLLSTLMPIGTVYDNGKFDGMENPSREYFELKCEKRVVLNPGDQLPLIPSPQQPFSITCLAARQTYIAAKPTDRDNTEIAGTHMPKDRDGSDNANSIVTLTRFGAFKFYDAGDLTWNREAGLVSPKDLIGEVDVYQVTHHGLDVSNNPVVLKTIKPRVAIMNNGHAKGGAPEVFANLRATESLEAVFQLHKNLRPDGSVNNMADEYIANHKTARECEGNLIKLSVEPDTQRYTVSIPASGKTQTFKTKASR